LETFVRKHAGPVALSSDAADYFIHPQTTILERPETLLVLNFAQLQKLAAHAHFPTAFTSAMGLVHLTAALQGFAEQHQVHLVIQQADTVVVAADGKISTTTLAHLPAHTTKIAAHAAVWWLQNPGQTYKALTTAVSQS
jgi:hypothetical protein